MGGVFVVLMGGMGVACVVAVFEFVWKSRKIAVEERVRNNGMTKKNRYLYVPMNYILLSFISDH